MDPNFKHCGMKQWKRENAGLGVCPQESVKDTPRIPEKHPLLYTGKIGVFIDPFPVVSTHSGTYIQHDSSSASLLPCQGDAVALQIPILSVGGSDPYLSSVLAACSYIRSNKNLNL